MSIRKTHAKAERIFEKALHEANRFGQSDVRVGATLNKLGLIYHEENRLPEAESAFRRSLPIFSGCLRRTERRCLQCQLRYRLGPDGYGESMPKHCRFWRKAAPGFERLFGSNSVKIASVSCMIGDTERALRHWNEAEEPLKRCAQIREVNGGILSADLGDAVNSLADVFRRQVQNTHWPTPSTSLPKKSASGRSAS